MNDQFLDSIAAFGKFGIENSELTRDDKELAKSRVDCLSSALKLIQAPSKQNMFVMGLNLEQIRAIKQAAVQYSIEKVVLFPYPINQNIVPLMRVYGGNREKFFCYLGLPQINPDAYSNCASECENLEKEYGVILYESK